MSSLAFLVSELQSLASETRRKHPEVREAAEKSLAILRSAPDQASNTLATDGPQSAELLRPVFMGCATKNAKIVAISLGSLQRLIGFKAVPQSAVPQVVATLTECASQGVDIQLRILQTILGLVTNFPSVHGDLLGDALLLCFRLQESRIAVVSSTAAATLRQLVMFVMDKVVMEDAHDAPTPELIPTTLPDGTTVELQPSSRDAFSIFEDLCLLANAERPRFLKLEQLHKTFALELIESVLTNYHALFHKHPELLTLLPHHLCPLLLRCLSERPALFPLALRATRVVFLILKQFTDRLTAESEIFLMLLVKIVSGDAESGSAGEARQPWMRVLAMEILRGLCADAELMRTLYALHDQQASSHIFSALLGALNRLACERPALLGTSSQLQVGANIPASGSGEGAYGTAVAGMVTATVSGVVGMLGGESGGGLSLDSAMKLQCIDQLDKAEAPPIPETYIYLLALQSLTALSTGFSSSVLPLYSSILSTESTQGIPPAPPALNINALPESTSPSGAGTLRTTHAMLEAGWPALLAAHSFLIGTNLSAPLFQEVLGAFGALAQTCGVLGLTTPRDAFLGSLAKLAIPSKVVSSVDAQGADVMTPRSGMFADISSTLAPAPGPPGLGDRNMACLKLLVACAVYLAGSLGSSWFSVLEALQNADYVLHSRMPRTATTRKVTPTGAGVDQDVSAPEADIDAVMAAIQRLFESSKNLEDDAFRDFVQALCQLSSEMVGMQAANASLASSMIAEEGEEDHATFSPQSGLSPGGAHRRRVSGIHLSRTLRTGDFGIQKLALVSQLNIHRIIYRSPEIAWDPITAHLLATLLNSTAPSSIRIQAARTLDDILVVVPRNITSTGAELRAAVQQRVLNVLAKQVVYGSDSPFSNTTAIDIRKMGLETLHQILQTSGHTLVTGWEIIFEMLGSVCKTPTPLTPRSPISEASDDRASTATLSPPSIKTRPAPLSSLQERSSVVLVRIAFQSLTLVCDSLSLLSPEHLRLCIGTIAQFGRQTDTNIALTSAASLLWTVSDSIQAKRADPALEPQYSVLWMQLLTELLGLCTDSRREVRGGAIQTLFRTLQLYGGTLSNEIWHECLWKIVFPVLETITTAMRTAATSTGVETPLLDPTASIDPWSDSKILALQAVSGIMNDFLATKIVQLTSFSDAWDVFVTHLQDSFLLDERVVSTAAMRCLEKSLLSINLPDVDARSLQPQAHAIWTRTWCTLDIIGSSIVKKTGTSQPLSPVTPSFRTSQIMTGGRTPFTQESLQALLAVLSATRSVSKKYDGGEWDLPALTRMMAILKAIITYPNSPDYRPDIDALSPVQDAVLQAIDSIDMNVPKAASLVLADLSEYATLPFLAAFDFEPPTMLAEPSASRPKKSKRVSYIAVSKKVMPWLVEIYLRFKDSVQIYSDGTLESVLAAYSIPLKLKYDCPAPSKFGNDPPLWKTATTNFLQIVKTCSPRIKTLGQEISDEHVEGLWRQMIDVFRGGLLADTSYTESLPLEVQNAEENFDLALVATLEIDVVPHIADARVPDYVITELAKMLQRASILHEGEDDSYTPPPSRPAVNGTKGSHSGPATSIPREIVGSTSPGKLLPRERFSYWCFDLLFLICSDVAKDDESVRRRLSALSLPSLLRRCQQVLASYVADDALRGNTPFPRAREEEILYVLRKLLSLKLWPGTFWAAFSTQPSQHAISLPPIDASAKPSQLIADAVKRSSQAHLFHFYAVFGDIASVPRKPPAAWMVLDAATLPDSLLHDEQQRAQEVDARQLARAALKEIGKEIGVQI
ncbi:hypothetical protein AURDEDRAFT_115706 [Auricularia subglabra TFB-10046 SS5]|uniref:Protein MON2 homolog n=1 Tax=Auricularia subglabra (strain TFB-10046 / SS5) TaxID=717982 RepID=J0WY57_AURST|nr:hypothetical protein AURDEDRAFT_115706 [Auricularia subglabra TFB-10046 SS5]